MFNSIYRLLYILLGRSLKFVIPFGVWIILFHKVFLGQSPIGGDSIDHYAYVHYLVSNFKLGVFPLWNPFLTLGLSQIFFNSFIGAFNPIWLLTFLLNLFGIKIYYAYLYTITFYFFIGTIGFYLLAKIYFQEKKYAYMAFLLLLFSSFGILTFYDLKYLITFVPLIWFFYFCLHFYKTQKVFSFVGLALCLMIGATCYFPPYWLTILFIVIVLGAAFFPRSVFLAIKTIWIFFKRRKLVFFVCCLAVGISFWPSIKEINSVKKKEIVFPWRTGAGDELSRSGPNVELGRMQGLMSSIKEFNDGFLDVAPGCLSFRDTAPFYVSIFIYIVALLGCLNKFTKAFMVKSLFCLILFFIIAIPNGPIFKILFYYLWGFNLIQGLKSFMPAFIMAFIFLAVEQEKKIIEEKFLINKKKAIIFIALVHLAVLLLLVMRSSHAVSSYLSVAASFCYFFWVFFRKDHRIVLFLFLYLAILLQPLRTIWYYGQNLDIGSDSIFEEMTYATATPIFSYHRPKTESKSPLSAWQPFWCYDVVMQDAPAFFMRDFPIYWTYSLLKNFSLPVVDQYVQNKFYLYDKIKIENTEKPELMEKILRKEVNTAILSTELNRSREEDDARFGSLLTTSGGYDSQGPEAIEGPHSDFRVVSFDVNSLKIQTNFDRDKFLVYTDSYHPDWQACVNKKIQKVYRANIAFKGIFLPKGFNEVVLRYSPLGGGSTYFFILMIFSGMFLWLIILFVQELLKETQGLEEQGCV